MKYLSLMNVPTRNFLSRSLQFFFHLIYLWNQKFYISFLSKKANRIPEIPKFFQKIFEESVEKAEKEAYEKREELGMEIDQLPALVIDAIQIVDIFRQDPTKSDFEEKKMVILN